MPGPPFYVWTAPKVVRGLSLAVILALLLTSDGFGDRFHVVNQVTFSPDGRWLAACSYSGRNAGVPFKHYVADVCRKVTLIKLDDVSHRKVIAEETRYGNQGPLHRLTPRVQFGPGDHELTILLAREGTLQVWNLKDNIAVERREELVRNLYAFAYSQDGGMMAACSEGQLILWNIKTLRSSQLSPDVYSVFYKRPLISFAPGRRKLLLQGDGFAVNLWNTDSGTGAGKLPIEKDSSIDNAAFSVDGDMIATVDYRGTHLWKVEDLVNRQRTLVNATLPDSWGTIDIVFLPDGRGMAVVGNDGLKVYDLSTLQRRAVVSLKGWPISIACSPDGKYLATGDLDGYVTLWDARSLERLQSIRIRDILRLHSMIPLALLVVWGLALRFPLRRP